MMRRLRNAMSFEREMIVVMMNVTVKWQKDNENERKREKNVDKHLG